MPKLSDENEFVADWLVRLTANQDGPEHVSPRLQAWAGKNRIRLDYIQPGKAQQNAYVERCNRTVRYYRLDQDLFENIKKVRDYDTK